MSTFANHQYSGSRYQTYRPVYPDDFFKYLAQWAPNVKLALDVGCGTGQAAVGLEKYVAQKVIAIDPSKTMIENASKSSNNPRIEFKHGSDTDLASLVEPGSVDLITAAEAAHWFEFPRFYDSVLKALSPNGKLAIFAYLDAHAVGHPEFHELLISYTYSDDALGPYWDKGRDTLSSMYSDLEFPPSLPVDVYDRVKGNDPDYESHPFKIERDLTLQQFVSYLKTYSAYHNWKSAHPNDEDIWDKFQVETGLSPDQVLKFRWETVVLLAHKK